MTLHSASTPNVLNAEKMLLTDLLGEEVALNLFDATDATSLNARFEGIGLAFHKIYSESQRIFSQMEQSPNTSGMREGNNLRANTIFAHSTSDYFAGLQGRLGKIGDASGTAEIVTEVLGSIGATGYMAAAAARAAQAKALKDIEKWHKTKGAELKLSYTSEGGYTLDKFLKDYSYKPHEAIAKHKSVILHNINIEIEKVLKTAGVDQTLLTTNFKSFFDAANSKYAGNAVKSLILSELQDDAAYLQSKVIQAYVEKARADVAGDAAAIKAANAAVTKINGDITTLKADLKKFNTDNTVEATATFNSTLDSVFGKLDAGKLAAQSAFSSGNETLDKLNASYNLSKLNLGLENNAKIVPKISVVADGISLGSNIAKLTTDAFANGTPLAKASTITQVITDTMLLVADGIDTQDLTKPLWMLNNGKALTLQGEVVTFKTGQAVAANAATIANITGGTLRLEQIRAKMNDSSLNSDQIMALQAEYALQTTAVTLSTLQGIMEIGVYAGGTAAKYLKVVSPVIGSIAAVAATINPTKWAEFSGKKAQISEVEARGDHSSELLGDLLSDSLKIQQDYYIAATTVDATFAAISGLLVSGVATAPLGFVAAAVGGMASAIIKAFEEPKLLKLVETYQDKITNDGTQSVDDFFSESFKQQWQETQESYQPLFDSFLQDGDYGSAVLLGSESFTITDLELIEAARVVGEVTKSSANFGASYTIKNGWDGSVVDIKESITGPSTVQFGTVSGGDRYVTFSAPLMDASAGNYINLPSVTNAYIRAGYTKTDLSQEARSFLQADAFTGWVIKDDAGATNTTFDVNKVINTFKHRDEQVVTKNVYFDDEEKDIQRGSPSDYGKQHPRQFVEGSGAWKTSTVDFSIEGGNGDDTYIAYEGWVNFDGGQGTDTATYGGLDSTTLARGIVIEDHTTQSSISGSDPAAADELRVFKTLAKGSTYHQETIQQQTIDGIVKDFSVRETVTRTADATVHDDLKSVEVIIGSKLADDIDVRGHAAKGNAVKQIHGLHGDDKLVGDTSTTILTGGQGDDSLDATEAQQTLLAHYNKLIGVLSPNDPFLSSVIGTDPLTQAKADDIQKKIHTATGQWVDAASYMATEAQLASDKTALSNDASDTFSAKIAKFITGEMVYLDGGDGHDVLNLSQTMTTALRDAYVELGAIGYAADGIAEAVTPGDTSGMSSLLAKYMATDFLNPFGQTIVSDVERIDFQLTHSSTLSAKPAQSIYNGLLNSAQLTGEDKGDSISNTTWYTRDYNTMIDTVLNTTTSHTEFIPRAEVESNLIGSYVSNNYTTDQLLKFATAPHTQSNAVVPVSNANASSKYIDVRNSIYSPNGEQVTLTTFAGGALSGQIMEETVRSHVMDYYVKTGLTYTFRFYGGIGVNSDFKAVVKIGSTAPQVFTSGAQNGTFTYTATESGFVPLHFVVERGDDAPGTTSNYGLSVKEPGETSFVSVGTERDILIADDKVGYETRSTTMTLHDGGSIITPEGHEGELAGTLQAGQKVVYHGEIFLQSDRLYEFAEMAPGLSKLLIGGKQVLNDTKADEDKTASLKVEATGFYSYSYEATNTTGKPGDYAVAISTVDHGKFLVLQGETGAPSSALDAKSLSVGLNLIGDIRSEDLTGGSGNDLIIGHLGHDQIEGGRGNDILSGGGDIDTFIFGPGTGHDMIVESQASDGAYDKMIYNGRLSDLRKEMYKGDLVIYASNDDSTSMTIANYSSLGGGRTITDSAGAEIYVDQLAAGNKIAAAAAGSGFFGLFKKKPKFPFFDSYKAAHSSTEFNQARESFLGAASDIDSGKALRDAQAKTLPKLLDITNDISFGDADALNMISLQKDVTKVSDSDGDSLLQFTARTSQATIDLSKLYPKADGSTPVEFSFGANAKFDSLTASAWQPLFRIADNAGSTLSFGQYSNTADLAVFHAAAGQSPTWAPIVSAPGAIKAGEWAHWGLTVGKSGSVSIYKDGASVGSATLPGGVAFQPITKANLGSDWEYTQDGFIGEMTDFWFMDETIDAISMATSAATPRTVVNFAPVASNVTHTMKEADTLTAQSLLNSATDKDGDTLKIVKVGGLSSGSGTFEVTSAGGRKADVTVAADGTYTVNLKNNFLNLSSSQTDSFSFEYTVEDPSKATAKANVTVSVTGESKSVGEWGSVTADGNWSAVNFQGTYTNPIVVAFIESSTDLTKMLDARLRNIDGDGFEVKLMTTSDYRGQSIATETVSYMVMEEGKHKLFNGPDVTAGKVTADRNDDFKTLDVGEVSTPFVFSSVQEVKVGNLSGVNYNQEIWASDRMKYDFSLSGNHGMSLTATREVEDGQPTAHTHGYIALEGGDHVLYKTGFVNIAAGQTPSFVDDFDFVELRESSANAHAPTVVRLDQASKSLMVQQDGPNGMVNQGDEQAMMLDLKQNTGFFYVDDNIA